jgi:hypothetical protein
MIPDRGVVSNPVHIQSASCNRLDFGLFYSNDSILLHVTYYDSLVVINVHCLLRKYRTNVM